MKEETKKSIASNLEKEDAQIFIKLNNKQELYYSIKDAANKIINDVYNFDYVCIVNNGSILEKNAKLIFNEYQQDREDDVKEIYLPLVLCQVDKMALTLNKHIWNSMFGGTAGILDIDLSLKQIDSTLFGAFIPVSLAFDKEYYNEKLEYYQQYHILNNLADNNLVVGIPKITLSVNDWDFKLSELPNEVKIDNFNLAREKWNKKNKVDSI